MSQVATQAHECEGWLKYAENGLDPYWALSQLYLYDVDGEEDYRVKTEIDGEVWELTFSYDPGGIAARDEDAADGTLYEWKIKGRGPGEAKATFQFKPRFPDMETADGERISSPWMHLDPDEGVAVDLSGSNVDPTRYPDLLPQFCRAVANDLGRGWDTSYFQEPILGGTAASNVKTLEVYVRIEREMGKKLIRSGGPMHRLAMHLSGQQETQGMYEWDNEDAVGKYHVLQMAPRDASLIVPDHARHDIGKQIKHYLLKDPDSVDEDDSTWHPKVGCLFQKNLNDHDVVGWDDLEDLRAELDEALLSILDWADIPTRPGPPFVPDDHFDAAARETTVPLYADPTPALESKQEHLLVTAMRDLTDADVDVLETLADGGGGHYQDLANRSGRTVSTIYRALERLEGILDSDDGVVDFQTPKIAEDIRGIVDQVEHSVENAADRIAGLYDLDAAAASSSAFQKWLRKYGADLDMGESGPEKLRIDTVLAKVKSLPGVPYASDVVEDALDAWNEDGRDPVDFRGIDVEWQGPSGELEEWKLEAVADGFRQPTSKANREAFR